MLMSVTTPKATESSQALYIFTVACAPSGLSVRHSEAPILAHLTRVQNVVVHCSRFTHPCRLCLKAIIPANRPVSRPLDVFSDVYCLALSWHLECINWQSVHAAFLIFPLASVWESRGSSGSESGGKRRHTHIGPVKTSHDDTLRPLTRATLIDERVAPRPRRRAHPRHTVSNREVPLVPKTGQEAIWGYLTNPFAFSI